MFRGFLFFIRCGLRYDKRYVLWGVLYQLTNSFLPILAALAPKYILDELFGEARVHRLVLYVGALTGYALIASSLSTFFQMDGFTRRTRVNTAFDNDLHRRLARADFESLEDPAFLDRQEKAKKFLYCDWHGFGYLLDCALNILGQLFTLIGIAAILATLSPWVLLLFAVLSAGGALVEGRARKQAMALSLSITADQRGWTYYTSLFDDFRYGRETRIGVLGDWLADREQGFMSRATENLGQQNGCYIRAGVWNALFTFVQQCTAYGCLIARALSGALSAGDFVLYLGAVTTFAAALRAVMSSLVEIRAYDLYYDQLDDYLSTPQTLREGKGLPLPQGPHRIVFEDVGFRYRGAEGFALRHVNLTLEPGQKLAVAGENGAGKTTFVSLLTRLYRPTEGRILLDGIDIQDIDYDSYMSLFSAVFQDFKLFSFSLMENVALSLPPDEARAEKALRQVGFGPRLDTLPQGIHTQVHRNFDENGFEPSGGEGQKIALARALYKDAPIVVLDEPTAALDPKAEYALYEQFHRLVAGKSAVFISHRLSSARFCDAVAVFHRGSLAEYGTHRELMEQQGLYAQLYSLQAQFYVD